MRIRPYIPADGILTMDYEMEYPWPDLPKELVVKVAEIQGIVGFVAYRFLSSQRIEIAKLGVDPVLRKLKIGTEIIHHVIQRAVFTNTKLLVATLPESNIIGAQFLTSFGFESRLRHAGASDFIDFERAVIL